VTPVFTSTASFSTIITVTEIPDEASTTTTVTASFTITTTTTITGTTTQTQSQTVTQAAPQATFYAACADNNIIYTINGQPIDGAGTDSDVATTMSFGTTAYDCCVTCITTPGCGSTLFNPNPSYLPFCYLVFPSGTCSQSNAAGIAYTGSTSYWQLSNGYCGHTTYGGSDGL
jgi:hypothetical protein